MVAEELRQGSGGLQRLEDTPMHRLAFRPEQAFVRGVADQRMLEEVGRLGRRAAAKDQLGRSEPLECRPDLRLRLRRDLGEQAIIELAADAGRRLRHLLDRLHAVQPRHQRIVQRSGDGERAERRVQDEGVRGLAQHAGFERCLGQFLDEQRHAIGLGGDFGQQLVGQALATCQPGDNGRGVVAAEAVQGEAGDNRVAAKAVAEDRPGGDQEHDPSGPDAIEAEIEQLERRRVDPVRVLDHEQHRLNPGEADKLVGQGRECTGPDLLRPEVKGAVARRTVEAEQGRQERCRSRHVDSGPGDQTFHLVEFPLERIVLGEPCCPGQVLDHRPERAVAVIGRALVADAGVWLGGHRVDQPACDPGLADPGLAGQQHDLTLAAAGLAPAFQQQR
ncbi:MAG: hypothetical protein R3C69_11140 [Geminicoccaceae bacterium]